MLHYWKLLYWIYNQIEKFHTDVCQDIVNKQQIPLFYDLTLNKV